MKKGVIKPILFPVIFVLLFTFCSSSPELQSRWQSEKIIINGKASEWLNSLKQIDDQKVWFASSNDDKYFYMCLVIEDRSKVMQMMRAGFITWFIPSSNTDNTFGIKYPLSSKILSREQMQNMTKEMFQPGNIEKMTTMFLEKQTELQILNKEKYSLSMLPVENRDGIKAKLGYSEGKFIYELQIPLAGNEDFSFPIAAVPGEEVKIKFETGTVDLSEMRPGGLEGMGSGSGQREGMRQGRIGGGGLGKFTPSKPLNFSAKVRLALPGK